ncbi:hypothetical protein ACFPC0_36650 [Streptomyces andamanensis]|uniref:Uncharacterized protein n=1 Tax=Streptomyces andamanensis TaxID=1565035 RepID=A0ABV8TQZ6_9ACTN|nr:MULTISPECIES: hypothetical protein [unclassified Streptomyces]EYT82099.1 hypothetical protein CF54_15400 [Streptomyces sp. Tu 6176]
MGEIRIGKPDVRPDTASHVSGIRQGNAGPYRKQPGHHEDGTSDARRSTGVHWKQHDTVMEVMPDLSPG